MLAVIKKIIDALTAMQANPPALVALVCVAAMGVSTFSLYVVLQLLGHR